MSPVPRGRREERVYHEEENHDPVDFNAGIPRSGDYCADAGESSEDCCARVSAAGTEPKFAAEVELAPEKGGKVMFTALHAASLRWADSHVWVIALLLLAALAWLAYMVKLANEAK